MISAVNHRQLLSGSKSHRPGFTKRQTPIYWQAPKKSRAWLLLLLWVVGTSTVCHSQTDSSGKRHRVAIFVPLYLDSAFDAASNYRFDKVFPKFLNTGLEFYEGVQLALDSLQKDGCLLDVHIYDSRSTTVGVEEVLHSPDFEQTELILAYTSPAELRQLADAAAHLNIPFINVNFPNDGGVTNNPYFVILNSTIKTHYQCIYKFLQRNYASAPIYVFRKKGLQDDRLKNYFTEVEKSVTSLPLKLKYVVLDPPYDVKQLVPYLDSTRKTVCVVGSLDEVFGKTICLQLASVYKTYPTKIIGMPTWDNIADFAQPEYSDAEIFYTTPFYNNPADSLVVSIQQYFRNKFYSRPSDMVFRGYETMYRFGKLLQQYGHNLSGNIGEKKYKVFDDFDIQPVFLNAQHMTLDYFENKKLYFIKKVNGAVVAVY